MKKIILIAIMILLASCNKEDPNVEKENSSEIEKTETFEPGTEPEVEPAEVALIPMVKVDGKIYTGTGYVNSMATCGTADGKILTSVKASESPLNDDESNFGTGYEYQFWEGPYINIMIDDKWQIFQNIAMDSDFPPNCVAHFKAEVKEVSDDGLRVIATDVPEGFFFSDKLNKPINLPIDNLNNSINGFITTEGLEGKTVEIWFDGEVKNFEPEMSYPIELGKVYRINIFGGEIG